MSEVLVLAYHAVSERWPADLCVTPDRLASQLGLLTARGYRGATFRQAVVDPPADKTVAGGVDDGAPAAGRRTLPPGRRRPAGGQNRGGDVRRRLPVRGDAGLSDPASPRHPGDRFRSHGPHGDRRADGVARDRPVAGGTA